MVTVIVSALLGGVLFILTVVLLRACGAANETDWGRPWMNRLDGLNRLFCEHYHRLSHDPVALPPQGPALLVSNHISGLDPLLMIAASRRPLRFIIAREEYQRPGLTWLFRAIGCIPVDRSRRPQQALRAALRALEQGEVVALFPHGRIQLEHHPPRRLRGGVAWLARQTHCPIVPLRIDGIRGHGRIITGVVLRSHARLTAYPPLYCQDTDHDDCLTQLADLIETDTPGRPVADEPTEG